MPRLTSRLVTNPLDALTVRRLRNSCAQYMTNARDPIGVWAQLRWYFGSYRRAQLEERFRIYLFHEGKMPVGYGSLRLENGELLITECVAAGHRGRGIGREVLARLMAIARREGRDLIAEIWTANQPSIGLHEKAGFVLERIDEKCGESLSVYRLPTWRG